MVRSVFAIICLLVVIPVLAELPNDKSPNVETLPASYPATWLFAHDTNFNAISDGKVVIVDIAAQDHNYKGSIGAGQFASFIAAKDRPELYVAETFYSRRLRGERTDTITIYDKSTLTPIDEIILPGGKRAQLVTHKNALQFLDNEKFLLVYNFSPAASVTVINIAQRKIVVEVPIPGCSMIYPAAQRSFTSLCGDNTMLVSYLDEKGEIVDQKRTKAFFDGGEDPLFAKPAVINNIAYFPSFHGRIQPVDLSGNSPKILPGWSLVPDADKAANWRPGGWQIIAAHSSGELYVLMHENGHNGSHKDGGSEVWVFDAKTGTRTKRLPLKEWGISIEVTAGKDPYLVVVNADFDLDVYSAGDGHWLRMIGGNAFSTPFILHAMK